MLKLKLNGVNDEILNAVSLLCEDYDFSLSDDGLNVDIKNVSGIGDATFNNIKSQICVD